MRSSKRAPRSASDPFRRGVEMAMRGESPSAAARAWSVVAAGRGATPGTAGGAAATGGWPGSGTVAPGAPGA